MVGELPSKQPEIRLEASKMDPGEFHRILALVEDRSINGLTVEDIELFLEALAGKDSPSLGEPRDDIANQAKLLRDELIKLSENKRDQ
ncbi:MAG: hypothetical protein HOE80_00985 [Candidatus Magasanikbacteria bacterium]|jgi:hypothetical protein|nr:hypothetical protein [Candidatus Magasanikbacteria bacterium]MBT4071278.1 hypothetical protein [Candidatus Magasanikbacteria bacterium]